MPTTTFEIDIMAHKLILTQAGQKATLVIADIDTSSEQLQILNALIAGNSGSTVNVEIKASE